MRRLVGGGRLGPDDQLPSERDLARALGVSRTTVTRAYSELVGSGYARARRGSGTVVRVPGSARGALGGTLVAVHDVGAGTIDLTCAAPAAVPQAHEAFGWALEQLPAQLRGTGYYPDGLPELRRLVAARYEQRGLPTGPDQVVVTTGALAGLAIVSRLLVSPGDRILAESPSYPNAMATLRGARARIIAHPMEPDGWDLPTLTSTLRRARPRLAVLSPDFHNPTGALMDQDTRERLAAALGRTSTAAVVDESSAELVLDDDDLPLPPPLSGPEVLAVGSVRKSLWGGFRIGWVRAPREMVPDLVRARATMDLGSSVVDQLAVSRLFGDLGRALADRRAGLRRGRDSLAAELRARLPDLSLPSRPVGWGCGAGCRLPFTADPAVLPDAVRRLARAYVEAQRDAADTPVRHERRPLIA